MAGNPHGYWIYACDVIFGGQNGSTLKAGTAPKPYTPCHHVTTLVPVFVCSFASGDYVTFLAVTYTGLYTPPTV